MLFHPVTLEDNTGEKQIKELLKAIDNFSEYTIVFIKGNSDTNGRVINRIIDEYSKDNNNVFAFISLKMEEYMSLLKNSNGIIGNSSSGIIEAPSFKIPTINIGDRQTGRIKAESVIDCKPIKNEIIEAINQSVTIEFQEKLKEMKNPYGDGNTSEKIIKVIKDFLVDDKIDLKKSFYDIEFKDN